MQSPSSAGGDEVAVGRIRRRWIIEHGLNLWIVSDNLRKGAHSMPFKSENWLILSLHEHPKDRTYVTAVSQEVFRNQPGRLRSPSRQLTAAIRSTIRSTTNHRWSCKSFFASNYPSGFDYRSFDALPQRAGRIPQVSSSSNSKLNRTRRRFRSERAKARSLHNHDQ